MLGRQIFENRYFFIGFPMFSHMLLMVIKFSVVRKRPRMMRGCCVCSRRSPCLLGLPYYLVTRKAIKGEEGKGQSQPEGPGGGQTTRRDSGEVPKKEPRSRLRQRRERLRRKLRRGPGVGWDWFSNRFLWVLLSKRIRKQIKQ